MRRNTYYVRNQCTGYPPRAVTGSDFADSRDGTVCGLAKDDSSRMTIAEARAILRQPWTAANDYSQRSALLVLELAGLL